jgi:hypothetical protein
MANSRSGKLQGSAGNKRSPKPIKRRQPIVVPREYAGKWVAWSSDGRSILGSGNSIEEARVEASSAGVENVRLQWIPREFKTQEIHG